MQFYTLNVFKCRLCMNIKRMLILVLFFSINAYGHNHVVDDSSLVNIMKQPHFKVEVSSRKLVDLHHASTLLISCVDFRLRDEIEKFMRKDLKLLDHYDEITIPGAALAMATSQYPAWKQTIEQVITLAMKLHGIKYVILLDHRDCGAYKTILGEGTVDTKQKETDTHKKILSEAKRIIKLKFPELEVYTLLMGLDGLIENIQ